MPVMTVATDSIILSLLWTQYSAEIRAIINILRLTQKDTILISETVDAGIIEVSVWISVI